MQLEKPSYEPHVKKTQSFAIVMCGRTIAKHHDFMRLVTPRIITVVRGFASTA